MKVGVYSSNLPHQKADATLPRHLRRLRHLIRHPINNRRNCRNRRALPSRPPSPWEIPKNFPWTGRENDTDFSLPAVRKT